ncbi:MAG: MoaD/ThiS family protein, partial [Chloroflexi bacterium]|nr:MoaD/ThiS family protein [Chloroflexota bacterium]
MAVSVYIPTPFRRITANREYVQAEGTSVAEVLDGLTERFPGFDMLVYDEHREVPAHINIYVNNQEIQDLEGTATSLDDGDQVAVIPALAGGADGNGGAAAPSAALTPDEAMRYSRHIIMGQV